MKINSSEADYKAPNGKLVRLRAELDGNKVCSVKITGDFFLHPEEKIVGLEKALAGKELEKVTLQKVVGTSLSGCQMAGVSVDDFVTALLKLRGDQP
jgi:lipoate-protein ligase A